MKPFEIKFKKFLKENIQQFNVVFYDDDGGEVIYKEPFNSKQAAYKFGMEQEWDEQVEVYKDGDYRFETKYHYHNPDDGENYIGYEVKPL